MIALFESALAEFPHPPPDALLDPQRATADARRSGSRAPTVSALQQEVSLALEALGLAGLRREVDDGGVFQYDFVVDGGAGAGAGGKGKKKGGVVVEEKGSSSSSSLPSLPVVVEVDGSPHFFVNDLRQPLGDTRFKRRLVRAQVRSAFWSVRLPGSYVYIGDTPTQQPNQQSHATTQYEQRHRYAGLVPIPWYDWRAATATASSSSPSDLSADDGPPARLEAVREYLRRAFVEQGLVLDDYLSAPGAGKRRAAAAAAAAAGAAGGKAKAPRKTSSTKAPVESKGIAAPAVTPASSLKRRGRPPKSKQQAAPQGQEEEEEEK